MKNKFIHTLLFLLPFSLLAQGTDSIFIWQGFKHEWTYNHRINRIGSFIDNDNNIVHTAASGMGADSAYFESSYMMIQDKDISSYKGKVSFHFDAKEKKINSSSLVIDIPLNELKNKNYNTIPLLNGFDLVSLKNADKVEHLNIEIKEEENNIRIYVDLMVNCSTLECPPLNKKMEYRLDVYYIVLYGKDLHNKIENINTYIAWDKKNEIFESDNHKTKLSQQNNINVICGINQFSILTGFEEHWILEWENIIRLDKEHNQYFAHLFFKEWSAKMKKESAYPKHSRFSKRNKGNANLKMEINTFLINGSRENIHIKGNLFWRGRNRPADSEAAIWRKSVYDLID